MCSHSARARVGVVGGVSADGSGRAPSPPRAEDLVGVDGLGEVVVGAEAQGLDGGGDAPVAGEDHDAQARDERAEGLDEGEART